MKWLSKLVDSLFKSTPEEVFERAGHQYAMEEIAAGTSLETLDALSDGWDGPDAFDRGMQRALAEWRKEHPCG